MESEFCKTQSLLQFDENLEFLFKFLNWEYTALKTLEKYLEICFVEHILDTMMKHGPV